MSIPIHYPKTVDELETIFNQTAVIQGDNFDWFSNVDYGGVYITDDKAAFLPINQGIDFFFNEEEGCWSPSVVRIVLGDRSTEKVNIEISYALYEEFYKRLPSVIQ